MPNTVNYAEVWQPELLEIMTQETLCTPSSPPMFAGWTPGLSISPAWR